MLLMLRYVKKFFVRLRVSTYNKRIWWWWLNSSVVFHRQV